MNSATNTNPAPSIATIRGRFYIVAGTARLSKGFRSEAAAQAELDEFDWLYDYNSKSASVSLQNTPARTVLVS